MRAKLFVYEFHRYPSRRLIALVLSVCCACTAYDPQLLLSSNPDGISREDAGDDASDGSDSAAFDCTDSPSASCRRSNAETTCVAGSCVIAKCLRGHADCDAEEANGCEARLDSPEHCGLCGAACRFSHASGACVAGQCEFGQCDPGYADCDGDDDNGCETSLHNLSNCGGCGVGCSELPNAVVACDDGHCGIGSCVMPYGDCNGDSADGCEQRLNTASDCGACGGACTPANGTGTCESGACVVTGCQDGFVDCNGRAADGCETRLDTPEQCGGCGAVCKLAHATRMACITSGGAAARCDLDHACPAEAPGCIPGAAQNGCEAGYSDCDGNAANGCEANLSRLSDCGACGNSCVKPNAVSQCRDGECELTGCLPGFTRCDGDATCRSLANDPAQCGQCGQACSGTSLNCAGGKCTGESCRDGRADCDGEEDNECETELNTVNNCGVCGLRCAALPHATVACRSGSCGIGSCEAGWKDCDGEVSNGCEVNLRTTDDCGECERPCIASNATTSCGNGQCRIDRCGDGRGDCNRALADGCEADFSLPDNCGGCGNACAQMANVASSSCGDSVCNLVCQAGRADCDRRTANGCEADLSSAASCGACGNDCTMLAHVTTADCTTGSCRNLVCDEGFADCNGDPADGCERALNTATNCGGCNRACAPAHGTASCNNGTCQVTDCDSGFGNCNFSSADGCEVALSTPQNCGACAATCAGGSCVNGQCACDENGECAAGSTCCDGICAEDKTECFPWPCIPGTDRPAARNNCGGCGNLCLLWCCAVP